MRLHTFSGSCILRVSGFYVTKLNNGCRYSHTNRRKYSTTSEEQLKSFAEIPGLKPMPLLGSFYHFMPVIGTIGPKENFYEIADYLYKNFGPIVKLDGLFARANMVILYDPDLYEQIFRAEEVNPLRPGFATVVYFREEMKKSTFDGVYGLTTAQGSKWRDFRTKVNPALLKPKLVKLYAPGLDDIARDMVTRLMTLKDDNNYLQNNLDLEITKWSLESVGLVALGTRLGCLRDDLPEDHPARQLIKCAKDIIELAYKLEFFPSPWKYISTPNFKKMMTTLDLQWVLSSKYIEQAKQQINERSHDIPEEEKSVIEKLLAIDEKVAIMMANEMLMAGIDTVAFATTGLLYQLATNPKVQDKLRQEIRSEDPNKRYLKACLKESLRLWPVVPSNLRRTTKDHIVAGYKIPKGVEIISANEYLSRMAKYYPQPTEFIPERWLVEKTDPLYYGHAHPMITLPFGYGVRTCIGRRIAELEIEALITQLIDQVEVSWDGPPIKVVTRVLNTFVKPYHFKFKIGK